jgi:hypothetical protein
MYAGFEVETVETLLPYHVVVVARRPFGATAVCPCDETALRELLRKSPFPSDREVV